MSAFPFVQLPLHEAIPEIQRRLGLHDLKVATRIGADRRSIADWKKEGHVPVARFHGKLKELAREANVGIEPGSLLRENLGGRPRKNRE